MRELWKEKRNWAMIGEAGCGKTEVAMYLARRLKAEQKKQTCLIDMDQTKGMFRARDFAEQMRAEGIETVAGPHFMDMPVVPHGVERLLRREDSVNVLDIGGNEIGAVTLGQFAASMNAIDAVVLYLINPYRNFSGTTENIRLLKEGIQAAGRVKEVHIIANPNVGKETTEADILNGYERLSELLAPLGSMPRALVIPDWVDEGAFAHLPLPKWMIQTYIKYP